MPDYWEQKSDQFLFIVGSLEWNHQLNDFNFQIHMKIVLGPSKTHGKSSNSLDLCNPGIYSLI